MKEFFDLPVLLIKKRIKALNENEKQYLDKLREKYPFARKLDYDKIVKKIDHYESIDEEKAWETIEKKQKASEGSAPIPLNTKKWFKYAAIFIGLIGIGAYFYQTEVSLSNNGDVSPNSESITLQLENGDVEIITRNQEKKITTAKGQIVGVQKEGLLKYKKETNIDKLVYNELNIPYGKRFELILSDGTHVHLNSGTSLKYPVKFIEGQNRQVYLKGEAYFDVAKDSLHPFTVNAESINVKVLGTKFNISAYPEDNDVNTVLVEGSVNVSQKTSLDHAVILEPGHKATWNKVENSIAIDKVVTDIYTGWIEGRLIFKDVPFAYISKRLERHYNVTIINENETLMSEKFDASFDIETIEQVLRSFKENHPALDYTVDNNGDITIN